MEQEENAVNGAAETAVEGSPSPALKEPRTKLDRMDLLEVRNVHLEMQSIVQKKTILQLQMETLVQQEAQVQQRLHALRVNLSQEYGVDLQTVNIAEDGSFVPRQ